LTCDEVCRVGRNVGTCDHPFLRMYYLLADTLKWREATDDIFRRIKPAAADRDLASYPADGSTLLADHMATRSSSRSLLGSWATGERSPTRPPYRQRCPLPCERSSAAEWPASTTRPLACCRLPRLSGGDVGLRVLTRAAGLDVQDCLDRLEPLDALGLLGPVAGDPFSLRFAHDIVRESIGSVTPLQQLTRLHLRIADALDLTGTADESVAERLAYHLWESGTDRGRADPRGPSRGCQVRFRIG
jgi:hypothetical protein